MGIAPLPFINYGASMAGQENTTANTGVQNATAQLTGEQAQQQQMNTQVQRASMPLIMKALADATADQTDSNAGSPATDRSGVSQSDWHPSDGMEDAYRKQNYVAPYMSNELQMLKVGTALSMNPNNPQAGKAIIDRMQTQRQARIDTQTSQNQLKMGNVYDAATAVASSGNGTGKGAYRALDAVDPADAEVIRKQNTDADGKFDEDTADAQAVKHAQHTAAVSHLYSGRPTKIENGQLLDEKTGQAVTGQAQLFTGLDAKERQAEYDKAIEPIKYTTPDNVEHQELRYKAPVAYGGYGGKLTPAQAVLAADQAARHAPDNTAHPPGIIPNEAASNDAMAPASHGATAAVRVNAKNNATPPTTGADIAAGKAPATMADTGTLPGVNPAKLPKMVSPVQGQGAGTGGTIGTAAQTSLAARQAQEIESTKTAGADAQVMRSQITQARSEMAKIDPRTVGPGSSLYNTALKVYTAASGSAPNALIDETVLDKFLNQIGASNVRNLLAGQRITNQEMMTFLTRGSPSTAMPLGGIKHLIDYLDADNEYTLRYNRTKMMGLKSGADPDMIDSALSNDQQGGVSRSQFVGKKTGSADALGAAPAANSPQADITQEAHGRLKQGDAFYWQGKLHHKGVD